MQKRIPAMGIKEKQTEASTGRKIASIIAVLSISSCSILMPPKLPTTCPIPEGVTTAKEAWKWVASNIKYKAYPGNLYRIQTAQETYSSRTGDCKAFCILLATIIHET
jgi:hypothetical protein